MAVGVTFQHVIFFFATIHNPNSNLTIRDYICMYCTVLCCAVQADVEDGTVPVV